MTLLSPSLQDFTRFGYVTGWGVKEIATLEWRDIVDGTIRLRPDVSKNAEGRVLMLVGALATLIARRRAARKDLMPLVFYHNGKRLTDFSKAWRRACREAGVAGKLFRDLRRTAARNMRKAGVDQGVRMQIIGHKTQAMDRRYNIVDEEDIRQGQLQTDAYLATLEPVVIALTDAQTAHT